MKKLNIHLTEPIFTKEMLYEATKALKNEFFLRGESISKFEEEFAIFIGTRYAIAVNSGTTALHLSLLSLDVGQGDVVITTPATFIATANAITYAGAIPYFVDIEEEGFSIDSEGVKSALEEIENEVKAIISVHLYGFPSDIDKITRIAWEYDIPAVEDACQAHGAILKGKRIGAWGDAGAFSFYPSKNMTVAGDGGMITTSKGEIAERARKLRDVGRSKNNKYKHDIIGYTARMNTVNAAIGRIQLKHLEEWNKKRRELVEEYRTLLEGIEDIKPPLNPSNNVIPAWHLFIIKTKYRDKLKRYLENQGIQCGIHYPIPVHLQPPYKKLGYREEMFPNAEKWAKEILSLPLHPNLTVEDIKYVTNHIKKFMRGIR